MARIVYAVVLITAPALAQWSKYPLRNVPQLPNGKPNLAAAAPKRSDGKPDLSGVWCVPFHGDGVDITVRPKYLINLAADLKPEDVSMRPWAEQLYQSRSKEFGKDFPGARCLPLGIPISIATPEPFKIVQTPDLIVILHETGNLFRQIFLDGRTLTGDVNPTWMGYSAGRWDGEALVVESAGFNDKTWLDSRGHPHSESLRLTERYTRQDAGHLKIQITVDDPDAYTKPWTATIGAELLTNTDLLEEVCAENEKDSRHLVGR